MTDIDYIIGASIALLCLAVTSLFVLLIMEKLCL